MTTSTEPIPTKVKKLDEDFQAMFVIVDRIDKTQQKHGVKLNRLISDVGVLKTDVAGLKTDMAGLKTDMAELRTDVMGKLDVIISRLPER